MDVNYEEKTRESRLKTSPHQEGLDAIPNTYIKQFRIDLSRIDLDPGRKKDWKTYQMGTLQKTNSRISTSGRAFTSRKSFTQAASQHVG